MKEIDIEKSKILGLNEGDTDNLKLGMHGYFSHYRHFETYVEGELDGFTYGEFMTSEEDPNGDYGNQWYDYFIPKENVVFKEKPKELRRFKDVDEFCNETCCEVLGDDVITIRNKEDKKEYVLLFIGYSNDSVHLGAYVFTFETLLKFYEFSYNNEWLPFGIEE